MAHVQKVHPRDCDDCAPRGGVVTHYEVRWTEMAFNGVGVSKRYRQQTFHTRREALAWKAEVETAPGSVRNASAGAAPFGSVSEEWLASLLPRVANGKLKARTHEEYGAVLRRHVLPAWAGVPIGAVTGRTAEVWAQRLAASGLKPRTFRNAPSTMTENARTRAATPFITMPSALGWPRRQRACDAGCGGSDLRSARRGCR